MPRDLPELLARQADFEPTTVDEAARTVELIWSTGASVPRRDWDGPFSERLSLDPAHVDLARLIGGSLLDTHNQFQLSAVLGVVTAASVDGQRGVATVQFSERPEIEAIWADVRAGIIRHVSVGYTVESWLDEEDPVTGARTRTAVAWTPREISLVGVAADPGAMTRSQAMPQARTPAPTNTPAPAATPTPTATPAPAAVTPTNNRADVNTEIRSVARLSGLDQAWIDGQIDNQATIEQARAAAFEAMTARDVPLRTETSRIEVGTSFDDPATRAAWMGEAVYARAVVGHTPSDQARQYAGLSLAEMAREILRLRSVPTTGLSPMAVVTRALHTTSDFSIVLGNTVDRVLRAEYEAAPAGLRQLARQTTARDFRTKTLVQLGPIGRLQKVNEHGEYTATTLNEAKEAYALATYGTIIGITRKIIVNDDLGAFTDLSRKAARAARETENALLIDLLTSNSGAGPVMDDTNNLFDATTHGNAAAIGAAPDETTLSAARLAMRKQTDLAGDRISVTPRYVLSPPDLETGVEKLLTAITPQETAKVNPFSSLTLVVESRLTDAEAWYVVADPMAFDGLEYAYLEGEQGPQTESRNGFEVDGVEVKVRLDFGAGFVDWRGWYRNAGQ